MILARRHRFESPTMQYLFDRFVGNDPRRLVLWERAGANQDIALMIYGLRTGARLTQAALARRVGTTASVISRLEDADYRGHSLSMLRRIAAGLGKRVEIRLVDDQPRAVRSTPPKKRPAA